MTASHLDAIRFTLPLTYEALIEESKFNTAITKAVKFERRLVRSIVGYLIFSPGVICHFADLIDAMAAAGCAPFNPSTKVS